MNDTIQIRADKQAVEAVRADGLIGMLTDAKRFKLLVAIWADLKPYQRRRALKRFIDGHRRQSAA